MRTFTKEQARAHYNRFGGRQDTQAYYEDPATRDLVAHAAFAEAQAVVEFGCGTGRFAERLLEEHLPQTARYLGIDLSDTMVSLARARLGRFGDRVEVRLTDGAPSIDVPPGACDRFVSTYVLDLLSEDNIRALLAEAHRILQPHGLLCLTSLTHGFSVLSSIVSRVVTFVQAAYPSLAGGCRPIELLAFLPEDTWTVRYKNRVAPYAIPSEIVVAAKRWGKGER